MPRGKSKKAREADRARAFALVRIWAVTIAAAVVVVLGVVELVSSGRLRSLTTRVGGRRSLEGAVVHLDRAIDGTLVKLGVSGATIEEEERSTDRYTWVHREKAGRLPYGISVYECNLAVTRAIQAAGGRVIRAGERGPDWRGLRTLDMRIGFGAVETHGLVLRESHRSEDDERGAPAEGEAPRIALIIDDLGNSNSEAVRGILDLDAPITVSVLPHCPHTATLAEAARRAGKEVMVHIPMEPVKYPEVDPGEGALLTSHTREELNRRIDAALDDVPNAVGANNHMGSSFTALHIPMRVVMGRLKGRGLYFLDSMTSPASVGLAEAARAGIPSARNRMFIDSPLDESGRIDVESQLDDLVEIARKRGEAVGIGHPYPETLAALRRAIPDLESRGVELVFVSQLVR